MEFRNIVDLHTHSVISFDGNDSCESLCSTAVQKGAKVLAITDHCDIDGADLDVMKLCTQQYEATKAVKEKYKNELEVLQGLEIGQGIYRVELTNQVLQTFDYDFILGSLHNLDKMEDFCFLNYYDYDVYELLQKYFEDIFKLSNMDIFDSLAHLTYPLRYIVAREKMNVDMSKFRNIIDAIFENLVKNKKALEINTSGLFMDMKDTLPNISLIKRYKEIGGEYITIGSDSHFAARVCQGMEQGMQIAYDAGFRNVTVFRKRNPILVPFV